MGFEDHKAKKGEEERKRRDACVGELEHGRQKGEDERKMKGCMEMKCIPLRPHTLRTRTGQTRLAWVLTKEYEGLHI